MTVAYLRNDDFIEADRYDVCCSSCGIVYGGKGRFYVFKLLLMHLVTHD